MAKEDKCRQENIDDINFKSAKSILGGLLSLFRVPTNRSQSLPSPLILATAARPGLSPTKVASRIIQRKSEAGLPVGPLDGGGVAPDELMERIRIEEIVNALTTEARLDVAIRPGTSITASGANAGGPVQVLGTIVGVGRGNAQIN
jgi:hypothetical protein